MTYEESLKIEHTKATWEYDWAIDENTGIREIVTIEDDV